MRTARMFAMLLGIGMLLSPRPARALEQIDVFGTLATAMEKGWEQALVEAVFGKYFEEKPETIRQTVAAPRPETTEANYGDLPAALLLGKHGRVDWREVMRLRQQKMGWGQIAHKLGIHPGTFNKLRKEAGIGTGKGRAVDRRPWEIVLGGYYGLEAADIEKLLARGLSLADVTFALNATATTGKSLDEILRLKRQLGTWDKVAAALGVKGEALAAAVEPKAKWSTSLPTGAIEDGGKAKDRGPGKGKGKGKGRGKK